jgi:tetratricopeptide (TPR) repeat protein
LSVITDTNLCMLLKNLHIKLAIVFYSSSFFFSCSTEKDAVLNVGYHNMTARYNGYFNARVIMNEALENYRAGTNEDYTKVLPLDLFPSKEDVPMIQENYELAFSKCEIVIQRHSMPSSETKNKAVENCRWIDDNWYVIGVIHYTRQEYEKAVDIFSFIDESPLYVDQERVHEARLWLAKTYIAQERYPEAKRILSQSQIDRDASESADEGEKVKESKRQRERRKKQEKRDKKDGIKKPVPFPKKLKDEYELIMAEFYIAQEDYKKAIPHLEKGIALTKKRKKRARYEFVLGQIYQEIGNGEQASFYYNRVAHSNAPYEMRFQAQIYKALSATSGGEELRKELKKMLKDGKNEEYKDQIYYALAEIEMKDGNKDLGIQYYSQSAFYSIKNDRQKGVSYLKLGDIYFADQDYLKAQKYYDSCVQVLPEEYETYNQIKGKAEGLSELVLHYEIYVFEDSVQEKAQMSPEELDKYLEQQLKDIKEAEKKRKAEEERRLIEQQNRVKNSGANSGSGSKWYFYNQKVSSSGFNDFRALWGQRVVEDNWRRSTKTSYSFNPDDPDAEDSLDVEIIEEDSLTVEMLKANLPLTPEAMDSSNNKLMNSLYMLGIIYKEQLKEDNEAVSYFEKITNRGIEHPKVLPAMYQLYLLYKKKGSSKSNGYKETILKDYANSEIAKIINDPDYLKKKQERDQEELNEYSKTLEDYRYQRYSKVIKKCDEVISTDTTNQFVNKYYLLKAFSIGRSKPGNENLVRSPLEALYKLSPTSEEGMEAKTYLDKLDHGINIVQPDTNLNVVQSPYIYDEALEHYFVLIFPKDGGRVKPVEINLANFNKEFFKSKQLKVKNIQFGEDQLIVVQKFGNLPDANQYYLSFKSGPARVTLGKMATNYEHFLINADNFKVIIKNSDLTAYLEFYKEKYAQ